MTEGRRHPNVVNLDEIAEEWMMKLIEEDQPTVGYYDDEPLAKE